ncbi:hypothetical protein CK215_20660 [Mesorhizobium sp. WSM3864]|uniref:DUF982 domain-containing protein n=1 Tax=unclassified Mesorhizobium TaxID=325217 RepID=UPI000BAF8B32|nr:MULTISPECIES: DUF982 domain-containing protein [unclassified Mesorhizobium]PBB90712.1 hypothetical protein CK215_20660 [Mesorhizobium sp. WSM3864]RUW48726.1 DUF982 domain-containing protein [Mesorhizobium sp. M1A.F.Ca.ET.072.01.1.1]TIU99481.1 MAG: DUF982 domain-containing protein [Mesorhizobium sp.]
MPAKRFSQPVAIFVGLGFPRELNTVFEAYQFLDEWTGSRSPTYATTLALCRAAVAGEQDAEAARVAFEAFARSRGILAAEAMELAAARAAQEWMAA